MPRKKLIRSSTNPYHVTARSNNREWFYIPSSEVWEITQNLLRRSEKHFDIKLEAFVLMSNHYHMLVHTPKANIDKFMHFFNKNLGQKISRKAGRINRIFGASYKWNLILSQSYYDSVLRYIYQNPMRANLVERCQDYPYCNLLSKNYDQEKIAWLNQRLSEREVERTIRKLRHPIIDVQTD
ncbi:MAG: hypothetical protein A2X86_04005 [Bdellovibrionales bacterium GWA2_49_15]|nr:MAG: hypothetical protein A2X86_04005 [Bdellovibrionales bacterium GWA2_49_15]HAZ12381.1 hypothetical protein [Bdellovibrionales bacterium]